MKLGDRANSAAARVKMKAVSAAKPAKIATALVSAADDRKLRSSADWVMSRRVGDCFTCQYTYRAGAQATSAMESTSQNLTGTTLNICGDIGSMA
jgi:hypothetical protein